MRNHYEAPEVIELNKAQDAILNQKIVEPNHVDNFGVANYADADNFDDFDE